MNEKLKILETVCHSGFEIKVNQHKYNEESVFSYLKNHPAIYDDEISDEMYEKMVETDTTIEICAWPTTEWSLERVFHYDLEKAIDEMLSIVNHE